MKKLNQNIAGDGSIVRRNWSWGRGEIPRPQHPHCSPLPIPWHEPRFARRFRQPSGQRHRSV